MRLLRLVVCALCAFLYADTLAQPVASATADLVFVGVVVKIAAMPVEGTNESWVVSTKIETIESGSLKGDTFSFRMHSPARAGLIVGKRFHFHATKTDSGYVVNEFQIKQA